jgi:hypothetical protein
MINKEDICVIIGSYPQNHIDTTLVSLTLEGFKNQGYDICLVSHAPLSSDLQTSCNYFIYSDENPTLSFPKPSSLTAFFANGDIHYQTNWGNRMGVHSLAILNNLKNALYLLKNKKYKSFIYAECDTILNIQDHELLESKLIEMSFHDKDYFFMIENSNYMILPVTTLFGGNINYFHHMLEPIKTEEDYFNICSPTNSYTLESLFSALFCTNVSENGYLDYVKPRDIFSSKWLGISNYGEVSIPLWDKKFNVDIDIVKDKNSIERIYCILNLHPKNELIDIKFYGDNILLQDLEVTTGPLYYWMFNIDGINIWRMEVYYKNKLFKTLERPTEEVLWNKFSYFENKNWIPEV